MNWKRGFWRIAFVLTVVGGVLGIMGGIYIVGALSSSVTLPIWALIGLFILGGLGGAALGCLVVWRIYQLLEWLVLGFADVQKERTTMTHKEIEKYRQKLAEIINRPKQEDGNPAKGSKENLRKLAQQVGASTRAIYTDLKKERVLAYDAGISDLINNIHQALQTATMVNMCETANKNFIIALIAIGVAILTALFAILTR